jgi:hypothetical protein
VRVRDKLDLAGIPYREETFLSGFWGRRFIFSTRKDALAAQKALQLPVMAFHKEWAVVVF